MKPGYHAIEHRCKVAFKRSNRNRIALAGPVGDEQIVKPQPWQR